MRYFKLDPSAEYELLEGARRSLGTTHSAGPEDDANAVSHRMFDDIEPQMHVYLRAVPSDDQVPPIQPKQEAPPTPVTPAVDIASSFRRSPTPLVEPAPAPAPVQEAAPEPVSSGTHQAMAEDARRLGLLDEDRPRPRAMSLPEPEVPDSDDEVRRQCSSSTDRPGPLRARRDPARTHSRP